MRQSSFYIDGQDAEENLQISGAIISSKQLGVGLYWPASKRLLNGVLLVDQYWSVIVC